MAPWGSKEKAASAQEDDLSMFLSADQRAELPLLIANVSEVMRKQITDTFDAPITSSNKLEQALHIKPKNPGTDTKLHKDTDKEANARKLEAERGKKLSQSEQEELKKAALDFLQKWQGSVISRVVEALSAKEAVQKHTREAKEETANDADNTLLTLDNKTIAANTNSEDADAALIQLYPPLSTPLYALPKEKRILLLHALLLLLLSLEHYIAPSRILLLYIASSLHLPLHILAENEVLVAQGLVGGAHQMSGDEATKHQSDKEKNARRWKIGLAGVAGAALIGVTGGLAAPLVAAGVGTVMAGLGLEATVAAELLGTLAESGAVVGTLFGAYGARMTSEMMEQYAKEVQDFAFLPLRAKKGLFHKATDVSPSDHRLRITIGISGWLTRKEDVVNPWRVLGHQSEVFALRWELDALIKLGTAMETLVGNYAWSVAKKEIIARTVFASLTEALWPLDVLEVGEVVDNPFSVAMNRADKAGLVLADALIDKVQGERPVTLIGYSLGARVIYSCLGSLAKRRAFGLVESVALMGTPAPSNARIWRALRSVVSGRLVNVFSEHDLILAFLYRTSSIHLGIAGIQEVEDVKGVENSNVSEMVSGHLKYQHLVGSILQKIGWEDVDTDEVAKVEDALSLLEKEEKKGHGKKKSEKEAKEKIDQVKIQKGTEKLSLDR